MTQSPQPAAPRPHRGAAQIVLVMVVLMVIGVAATSAVRRSIAARRADQHRDVSLVLDRMLEAAEQWTRGGGEISESVVTLRLPSRTTNPASAVEIRRTAEGGYQASATLSRNGRPIANRSRILDVDTHDGNR